LAGAGRPAGADSRDARTGLWQANLDLGCSPSGPQRTYRDGAMRAWQAQAAIEVPARASPRPCRQSPQVQRGRGCFPVAGMLASMLAFLPVCFSETMRSMIDAHTH